jgi:hypothetical protein
VDFSRASYGYALNVTPLQMACAYSAIANDGKLLKPRIIKSLVANDGTVVETFPTEVVSQVLKPATARKMREALQKVTETGGTATKAVVPGYKTAGKTGTAKKHNPNPAADISSTATPFPSPACCPRRTRRSCAWWSSTIPLTTKVNATAAPSPRRFSEDRRPRRRLHEFATHRTRHTALASAER